MGSIKVKQVIVIRTDLNMPNDKLIEYSSHASMCFLIKYAKILGLNGEYFFTCLPKNISEDELSNWLEEGLAKVVVSCNSEQEIQDLHDAAWKNGLHSVMIEDDGTTMFNGVKTKTCIAIGPNANEKIDAITGHLKLL